MESERVVKCLKASTLLGRGGVEVGAGLIEVERGTVEGVCVSILRVEDKRFTSGTGAR